MNIEDLKNNNLIVNIVKTILDNEEFYNELESGIKEAYADKKIDSKDIPILLNILVLTYNNHSTFSIDKQDIKEVFILLFIEMVDKLGWSKVIDLNNVIELISPQIDLLLISINTNSNCLKKLCYYLNCCNNKKNNLVINNP